MVLDNWEYDNDVVLDFSRQVKLTDTPFNGSFNGSFRDECLNVNWLLWKMHKKSLINIRWTTTDLGLLVHLENYPQISILTKHSIAHIFSVMTGLI